MVTSSRNDWGGGKAVDKTNKSTTGSTSKRGADADSKSGKSKSKSTASKRGGLAGFFDSLFGIDRTETETKSAKSTGTASTTARSGYKTKYPEWSSVTKVAADISNVDESYFDNLIDIESKGNPKAKAKSSSAAGLAQFTKGTAARYGLKNPYDPAQTAVALGKLTLDNKRALEKALGRPATQGDLYMAHQQGVGSKAKKTGAIGLLDNPNMLAKDIVGLTAVRNNLTAKNRGRASTITAREFSRQFTSKFDGNQSAGRSGAGSGGGPTVSDTDNSSFDVASQHTPQGYSRGFWSEMMGGSATDLEISDTIDSIRSGTIGIDKDQPIGDPLGVYTEVEEIIGTTYSGFPTASVFNDVMSSIGAGDIKSASGALFGGVFGDGSVLGNLGKGLFGFLTGGPLGGIFGSTTGIVGDIMEDESGSSDGGALGFLEDYFLRVIIIILGLIFVAVGLAMFGKPLVQEVRKAL